MPSQNVIVLEQQDALTYRYVLWADVPTVRQPFYASPGKVSAWTGASAGDNTAIASGAVVELVDTVTFPVGTTLAQAQAQLQTLWTGYQARVTALNQWARYGTRWNGTSWTAGGVA